MSTTTSSSQLHAQPERVSTCINLCGTMRGYSNGCHEAPCRQKNTERQARYRAAKPGEPTSAKAIVAENARRLEIDEMFAELSAAVRSATATWRDRAACKGLQELFFDEEREAEAKAVCAGCPVRAECRDDTPAGDVLVRGGVSGSQQQARELGQLFLV